VNPVYPVFKHIGSIIKNSASGSASHFQFKNGFLHLRNLEKECFQIQISTFSEPDFFSKTLYQVNPETPNCEDCGDFIRTGPSGEFQIQKENGQWSWQREDRDLLHSEPGLGFGFLGEETIACFHLDDELCFYGLGEKTGSLNRRNSAFTNWNTDAFAYGDGRDPLYVSIPFFLAEKDENWFGILIDNTPKTRFNFGASNKRMLQISVATGPLNLIFIPGPKPEDVLQRYHRLTGFMPMPPRWALGLQQCRYSYYPEHELRSVASQFRNRNIPCDVLYLDIHYMDAYKVFTVDKSRFPDLKKCCEDLKKEGFRIVAIQDPGIKPEDGYEAWESGKKEDVFVRYPDGEHWIAGVWPGDCAFPDFTDEKVRQWWATTTAGWLKETGVSGLWNDMNEPATWGQDVPDLLQFSMEGRGSSHREAHNVYGQCMAEASRLGLELARPGERPFVLSRAGFAGIHRTAAIWSGDNVANEEHFFLGIRLMLGMAMSGVSFSGPDVGGFVGDAGRDLFVRWLSVASFFPFFRLHSMIDSRDNEPWSYGELAEAIATNYIRLRYKLLPVLYSTFYRSVQTGIPVVRPSFWEMPGYAFQPTWQHQFFLGNDLLVVPAAPSQHAVQAQLPPGGWYGLFDGRFYFGNQVLWLSSWIDQLPVLVRQGAILVSRDPGHCAEEVETEAFRDVHLFHAAEGENTFVLYEDDGINQNPEEKELAEIEIFIRYDEASLSIIRKKGSWPVRFRHLFLWHFPVLAQLKVQGENKMAFPAQFEWLGPLPNFDPFEDKGKSYFSDCQCISIESFVV
jgi:alpha-glucosidase